MDLTLYLFLFGLLTILSLLKSIYNYILMTYFGVHVSTDIYGKNTWAVITGSTDGIGKAIANDLASRGFHIILIARELNKLT